MALLTDAHSSERVTVLLSQGWDSQCVVRGMWPFALGQAFPRQNVLTVPLRLLAGVFLEPALLLVNSIVLGKAM